MWDLEAGEYAWLTPAAGALHRSCTPEQAQAELRACGVDGAVLVQAEDSERDTEAMLAVAAAHAWVLGVVGWVDLDRPERAAEQLDRWSSSPPSAASAHLVHDDPRDDLLALPAVRRTLQHVAQRGLPVDVPDAWPRHLRQVADLAAALPELRLVVDHLGKPPYGSEVWPHWRAALAAVAEHPTTTAKVSGLQVSGEPLTVELVRPAWETALELFGPERLLWGSDWPMTVRSGGYAASVEVAEVLVGELSVSERGRVLGGTAREVYGLSAGGAG